MKCNEKDNKMTDKIVITQENLHLVEFKGISFDVVKRSSIDNKKIEITYKVSWDGLLGKTALQQASMHQSKNWYNNHRPSSDEDVMSRAEFQRRKTVFLAMDGKVNEIEAVASTDRKRTRELSPMELATMIKEEKDPEVRKFLTGKLVSQQKAIVDALASIK